MALWHLLPSALADGLVNKKKMALAERALWLKPLCFEFYIRQLKQTAIKNENPLTNALPIWGRACSIVWKWDIELLIPTLYKLAGDALNL